jgi:hypothetical protein
MSAVIVSDYHINALVTYGVEHGASFYNKKTGWYNFSNVTAQDIAEHLYGANVRSVNSLYKERTRYSGFKYKKVAISHLLPADVISACNCLDYQSCEIDTWEGSCAKQALEAIHEKAVSALTANSTTWELKEPA